jgi:hypothetical protein
MLANDLEQLGMNRYHSQRRAFRTHMLPYPNRCIGCKATMADDDTDAYCFTCRHNTALENVRNDITCAREMLKHVNDMSDEEVDFWLDFQNKAHEALDKLHDDASKRAGGDIDSIPHLT